MERNIPTCLIVSGNGEMHRALHKMMADYPFRLRVAESGAAAIDACRQDSPALMVLDCELDDQNGASLLPAMAKAIGGNRMPPVLACSQRGNVNEISMAIKSGASECLVKPFDADLLDFKLRLIGAVKGQTC